MNVNTECNTLKLGTEKVMMTGMKHGGRRDSPSVTQMKLVLLLFTDPDMKESH